MFDKRKCRKCKYYGKTSGAESCSYSLWTQNTCLHKLPDGTIVDRRGDVLSTVNYISRVKAEGLKTCIKIKRETSLLSNNISILNLEPNIKTIAMEKKLNV